MNDYLAATNGLAIEKSVPLEADVDEPFMLEETMHLLRLADCSDNPLEGVVACGRPAGKEVKTHVGKIGGHSKLRRGRGGLATPPEVLGQNQNFLGNVCRFSG